MSEINASRDHKTYDYNTYSGKIKRALFLKMFIKYIMGPIWILLSIGVAVAIVILLDLTSESGAVFFFLMIGLGTLLYKIIMSKLVNPYISLFKEVCVKKALTDVEGDAEVLLYRHRPEDLRLKVEGSSIDLATLEKFFLLSDNETAKFSCHDYMKIKCEDRTFHIMHPQVESTTNTGKIVFDGVSIIAELPKVLSRSIFYISNKHMFGSSAAIEAFNSSPIFNIDDFKKQFEITEPIYNSLGYFLFSSEAEIISAKEMLTFIDDYEASQGCKSLSAEEEVSLDSYTAESILNEQLADFLVELRKRYKKVIVTFHGNLMVLSIDMKKNLFNANLSYGFKGQTAIEYAVAHEVGEVVDLSRALNDYLDVAFGGVQA